MVLGGKKMKGNLAMPSSKLWSIGAVLWLMSVNCKLEAVGLSSFREGGREQHLFKRELANENGIGQTFPSGNLLARMGSPSNFSITYDHRTAEAVAMDAPTLLVEGGKVQPSKADDGTKGQHESVYSKERGMVEDDEPDEETEPRRNQGNGSSESQEATRKSSILKNRIGPMLTMLPLMMQLWSLPSALASIKMSLLKSIFVAKLALLLLVLNALRNYRKDEVVLVHQAQHHQHYYHEHDMPDDENDESPWWGK